MQDIIIEFYEKTSVIDLLYLVVTIFSLIKCYKKGFVLSILSMAKWLFAYMLTLLIFPRVKPYLKDVVDNEYILDNKKIIHYPIVEIFSINTPAELENNKNNISNFISNFKK